MSNEVPKYIEMQTNEEGEKQITFNTELYEQQIGSTQKIEEAIKEKIDSLKQETSNITPEVIARINNEIEEALKTFEEYMGGNKTNGELTKEIEDIIKVPLKLSKIVSQNLPKKQKMSPSEKMLADFESGNKKDYQTQNYFENPFK